MLPVVTVALYLAAAVWFAASTTSTGQPVPEGRRIASLALGALAAILHIADLWLDVFSRADLALSAAETASVIAWLIAVIAVSTTAVRPRFAGISAVLLLVTAVLTAVTDEGARDFAVSHGGWELVAHVALATLAFACITVGAVLAIALALLDSRLRRRRPLGHLTQLPPVATLEAAMFQAIAAGFSLLSLALFSGFFFVEDLFAQHLVHKTVLACTAWIIFGVLLAGRWRFGWRGRQAVRWTLGGFFVLGLAYFGSKLILELVFGRHWG